MISHMLLYPYIVHAIQAYLTTPATEIFLNCPQFEISDPWDSLTEEEYIEDLLQFSCEDTDCSDYKPKQFNIFGKQADDHIGYCYQSGGKRKHCIVLKE